VLEAGQGARGGLPAGAGLGRAGCPVGGCCARRVDAFLGIEGLYEASLYLLPVGGSCP
jgi:hypothetical protein